MSNFVTHEKWLNVPLKYCGMNTGRFLKCAWPFFNIMHEWVNFVGNKAKGRISKQVLQENKARQIFSDICFSENLASFVL